MTSHATRGRRKSVSIVAAVLMILPLFGTNLAAQEPAAAERETDAAEAPSQGRASEGLELEPAELEQVFPASRGPKINLGSGTEPRVYLIRLHDPAVPTYQGGSPGLARTAPRGAERLDTDAQAVVDYRDHLEEAQVEFVETMERTVDRDVEVPHTYQFAVNGLAAVLTPDEAREVAQDPAVAEIMLDEERELHTDRGPEWINADAAWNATADLGLPDDYKGEGMVIGVIDTGISPGNDSFADVGDDGYDHDNPRGQFYGVCDSTNSNYDPNFPCNDKLIGAYNFVDDFPAFDNDGHGSHTSSTAGGNFVEGIVKTVDGLDHSFDISGVAPHANIISYLGCCSVSALTASIDQAIDDEVDVINYSIGSSAPSALWSDFDTVGYLNAREAGIFVATSNGNSGPLDATTGSPADAPWIISVGASTHDRRNQNVLVDLASSAGSLDVIEGTSVTGGLNPEVPIVLAESVGDALCQATTGHEAEFAGSIVICDRGVNGRVEKSSNVAAQGAVGFVLINDEPNGDSLLGDEYAIPGVFIGYDDGQALKAWLDNGASDHTAGIAGTEFVIDEIYGDHMASFSSRGPNRAVDTMVPDVVAPGVDILAALGADSYTADVHGFNSGTSMASPHVAGAGALIMQARPDWTPAEVQSALMTTAGNHILDFNGDPATPFEQGAGLVNVGAAIEAGLLFDESFENYDNANPELGGDPRTLNLPSFANASCPATCSWSRTATAPPSAPTDVTWTVSVEEDTGLELDVELSEDLVSPGETIEIDVTATVDRSTEGTTVFGWVTLEPDQAEVPTVTMPVAVAFSGGDLIDELDVQTRRDAGSREITDLTALEITDLTSTAALVQADTTTFDLGPDSTPGDPYDTVGDNEVIVVDVPADTKFLVAEVMAAAVPDLDLFVGTGNTPSPETEVCSSTTPTSFESCWVEDPAEGQWWIMMQSWWSVTAAEVGEVTVATALVPDAPTANAGVDGPTTVPGGDPFDITFHWNLGDARAGDRYFGFISLGTEPANPGNIGTIPITLDRQKDDVTKTASQDQAVPGDTVRYDIAIQPNVTPDDLTYTITDTVPDGFTIDESSVTGDGVVDGQTITWELEMPTPASVTGRYTYTTSLEDATCQSPFGGYVDLFAQNNFPPSGVAVGANSVFLFLAGLGIDFYGESQLGLLLTPQGYALFGGSYEGQYWLPQELPDPSPPNGLMAALWADTQLVQEEGTPGIGGERGLTVATGSGGTLLLAEYDNPQMFGNPDHVLGDYQLVMWAEDGPGPDIFVVFGEPGYLPEDYSIGTEYRSGEVGTMVSESLADLWQPNTTLCFDYLDPDLDAAVLSYDVTVNEGIASGTYTNQVAHNVDDLYAQNLLATADVVVTGVDPDPDPDSDPDPDPDPDPDDDWNEPDPDFQFGDVPSGHLFEYEIEWLAANDITRGCNPPANTEFCPHDNVTRGQMAAFLVRALGLTDTDRTDFTNDNNSIFEADIERLAGAGITRGCNPPANTEFCPDDNVTRGQMAAFLFRALTR